MRQFQGSASASCGSEQKPLCADVRLSTLRGAWSSACLDAIELCTRRERGKKQETKTRVIFFLELPLAIFFSRLWLSFFYYRRRARRLWNEKKQTRASHLRTLHSTCLSFDPREQLDDLSRSPRERNEAAGGCSGGTAIARSILRRALTRAHRVNLLFFWRERDLGVLINDLLLSASPHHQKNENRRRRSPCSSRPSSRH